MRCPCWSIHKGKNHNNSTLFFTFIFISHSYFFLPENNFFEIFRYSFSSSSSFFFSSKTLNSVWLLLENYQSKIVLYRYCTRKFLFPLQPSFSLKEISIRLPILNSKKKSFASMSKRFHSMAVHKSTTFHNETNRTIKNQIDRKKINKIIIYKLMSESHCALEIKFNMNQRQFSFGIVVIYSGMNNL